MNTTKVLEDEVELVLLEIGKPVFFYQKNRGAISFSTMVYAGVQEYPTAPLGRAIFLDRIGKVPPMIMAFFSIYRKGGKNYINFNDPYATRFLPQSDDGDYPKLDEILRSCGR